MSKGKAIVDMIRGPGLVGHETAGEMDFLYAASIIKDPKWDIGDRVVTPDGRVFRYAKASGTLNTDLLAQHVTGQHIGYNVLASAALEGDTSVTLTVVATTEGVDGAGVIAEDELRGGNIIIFTGNENSQNRGIIGNSALAADGTSITIYLDGALNADVAAGIAAECIASPYLSVKASTVGDGDRGFVGLAMAPATDLQYCWLQTWGICWVAPDNDNSSVDVGNTVNNLQVVARYNGSVQVHDYNDSENAMAQHVGFVLSRGAGHAQGAPFIMLQISP